MTTHCGNSDSEYICTLDAGHGGDHAASESGGAVVHRWATVTVPCANCGQPITPCRPCLSAGARLGPQFAWIHTHGAEHFCTGGLSMAEPQPRDDGSTPDPDPHHCAVCGNTIGLRMLADLWYCDSKEDCYSRRHHGAWGGVL